VKRLLLCLSLLVCQLGYAAGDEWLLLEITRRTPACQDLDPGDRCWGTEPQVASFEMRAGETLTLPTGEVVPPAWVRLRHLWVHTSDAVNASSTFTITVDRTPIGARVQISDGTNSYLQSLPLNQWTELTDQTSKQTLWTRVSGGFED